MKTAVKKLEEAMASNSPELAVQLKETISVIDRTAVKGVIHGNTAARKISRLTRKVNAALAAKSA
jgi:small subunit ribosomal protein S20